MLGSVLSGVILHDHASGTSMRLLVSVLVTVFERGATGWWDYGSWYRRGKSTMSLLKRS